MINLANLRAISTNIFGEWKWQPPSWLVWVARHVAHAARFLFANPRRIAALLLLLAASVSGLIWYRNRPVPHYVAVTVTAPGLTEYGEKGISSIKPLVVVFDESAAPLLSVDKAVAKGI